MVRLGRAVCRAGRGGEHPLRALSLERGASRAVGAAGRPEGGAGLGLDYRIHGADGDRLKASTTVVHVDLDTDRAIPIPDDVRAAFEPYRG